MNRAAAKKHLAVITAFSEGKIIQVQHPVTKVWEDITCSPNFGEHYEYRIKPHEWSIGEMVHALPSATVRREILGEFKVGDKEYWVLSHIADPKLPYLNIEKETKMSVGGTTVYGLVEA